MKTESQLAYWNIKGSITPSYRPSFGYRKESHFALSLPLNKVPHIESFIIY